MGLGFVSDFFQQTGLLEVSQADESMAKSLQGDMAVLERLENEALELTAKILRIQNECGTAVAGSLITSIL